MASPKHTPLTRKTSQCRCSYPLRRHIPGRNVDLVLVPVTVTDTLGRSVAGLGKENFEIYEGKGKQEIRTLSSEDSPISMGILFDTSGSMSGEIVTGPPGCETELLETPIRKMSFS